MLRARVRRSRSSVRLQSRRPPRSRMNPDVLPSSETVIDASRTTRADMTDSVFASDVHACVARAEALIKATGLSISSPLPTTQSSAFSGPWYSVGVLRTRYQDRVARLQPSSKPGDCRRRIVSIEIRIKGWKLLEFSVNRYFHGVWSEACDSSDERTVRRCPRRLPEIASTRT